MAHTTRPRRACQNNSRPFTELYESANNLTSFLFSDEEDSGSGSEHDDECFDADKQQYYDPATATEPFDKYQGADSWIGRRVCKTFDELGTFTGVIFKARKDSRRRYRLFHVYYFDDNTFETTCAEEIVKHLIPEDKDGLDKDARQKYDNIEGLTKSA